VPFQDCDTFVDTNRNYSTIRETVSAVPRTLARVLGLARVQGSV
jgi:hypothetical protein